MEVYITGDLHGDLRRFQPEIGDRVGELRAYLEENLREKEDAPEVPHAGMAVLRQQLLLAQAIGAWLEELKKDLVPGGTDLP